MITEMQDSLLSSVSDDFIRLFNEATYLMVVRIKYEYNVNIKNELISQKVENLPQSHLIKLKELKGDEEKLLIIIEKMFSFGRR